MELDGSAKTEFSSFNVIAKVSTDAEDPKHPSIVVMCSA